MSVRQYDLVYILPPDTTEQQATEMHDQIAGIVSRMNGTIEKTENWGRRKLAYEIGPHKEGVYVLEVINGGGDLVKEIDRRLKVIDHRPPPDCQGRRREEGRRADAHGARPRRSAAAWRGLPPVRQPGEGRSAETRRGRGRSL